MEQEIINDYKCQMIDHLSSQIQIVCQNINCKEVTRKCCSFCKELHKKDKDFKDSDLKNLLQLQKIIQSFKDNKQEMIDNIYLQTDVQRLIITIEMIDLIERFQQREQYLLNIQYRLSQFEEQCKKNLNINDYLNYENVNQVIDKYLEKFQNELLDINQQTDDYIKNLENLNIKYDCQEVNQSEKEGEIQLKKIFKSISPKLNELQHFLYDPKISGNKLFEKKYKNEQKWSIAILEILIKQSYYLKSNVPLNQFKYLKDKFNDLDRYQEYLQCINLNLKKAIQQVYSIESSKHLESSLNLINKSITKNNKNPKFKYLKGNIYNNIGIIQYDKKEYYESIKTFEQCIRLDPFFVDAYNGLGNSLRQIKKYKDAIANYNKALEIDKYSVKAYFGKATVLKDEKNFEEAIDLYEKVIELDQKNVDAYFGKGLSYHYMQKYQEAINEYQKAIQLDPTSSKIYFNKGLAHHISQENQRDAIEMFERAIELEPTSIEAYYNLGKAFYKDNQIQRALKVYDQIIINDRNNINGQIGRGELLIALERPREAIQSFQRVLDLDPNNKIASKRLEFLNRETSQN